MAFPSTSPFPRCTYSSRMNNQYIEITNMEIDDFDEILSIEYASFRDAWSRDLFERELQIPISRNLIAKISKDNRREVAGYIIYWVIAGEVHIHKIAVRTDLRESGIASRLMTEALRLSREEGASLCILEVGRSNNNARKLYEKFGFTVANIRPGYYAETGDDAVVMCLTL